MGRSVWLALAALVLAGMHATASAQRAPVRPAQLTTVKISIQFATPAATFFMAQKNGYFKEENLDVQAITTFAPTEAVPALLRGDLDILGGSASSATFQLVNDSPGTFTIIGAYALAQKWGNLGSGIGIWVRKDLVGTAYSKPADIKGKTVFLTSKGSLFEYHLDVWLKQNGMTFKDVQIGITSGGGPALNAAMRTKRVEFQNGPIPWAYAWLNEGIATPLFYLEDTVPSANTAVLTANSNFLKNKPEAAIAFLRAMRRSSADYRRAIDAGPSSSVYKAIVDLVASVLKTDAAGIGPLPAGLAIDLNVKDLENQAKFFQSVGYIKKVPDTASYVSTRYLSDSRLQ